MYIVAAVSSLKMGVVFVMIVKIIFTLILRKHSVYSINCLYTLNIRSVKTQETVCEVVLQCNIHQYLQNNYMFRPCKRLFLEPVIRHIQWEYGGTRSRLTLYMWG
jgi:hypothetical protein